MILKKRIPLLKDMGIYTKLTVLFDIVLISTVVLLTVYITGRYTAIIRDQEITIGNKKTEELTHYIQKKYNRVYSLANYMHSSEVGRILADINEDAARYYDIENINAMTTFFSGIHSADPDFADMVIATRGEYAYAYSEPGNSVIDVTYPFFEKPEYESLLEGTERRMIIFDDPTEYSLKDREPVISFVGKIYNTYRLSQKEVVGLYILNIPVKKLEEEFPEGSGTIFADMKILNNEGIILFSYIDEFLGKMYAAPSDPSRFYTIRREVSSAGITVLYELPERMLYDAANRLKYPVIIISFCALCVTMLIVARINRYFTKRLRLMAQQMEKVEKGDFSVRLNDEGTDEISSLSASFNTMCERLDQYINLVYEAELQRKSAELDALQTQINPHFLYNTLESIKAQAVKEGDRITPEMIVLLGNMFRYISHTDVKFVTIEEEISYVRTYLKLQSYRYDEFLDIDISVEEDDLENMIPKLTLQPIVENIIKHAFSGIDRRGLVGIQIRKKDQRILEITVYDNGQGMEDDKLTEIRRKLEDGGDRETVNGIGIQNVHNRLRLLFGDEYGLQISSITDMGTAVKVIIPVLKKEDTEKYV